MRLILLRHGMTQANVQHFYAGETDWPLTQAGRECVEALRQKGLYPHADALWTSGMIRADQTLLAAYGERPQKTFPALKEYRFGSFEGRSYAQLQQDPAYQRWILDETGDIECPGGECRNGFRARVLAGWAQAAAQWQRDAVLVTHGGVIATLMDALFPQERDFYAWQPGCGLGYTLTRTVQGTLAYCKIENKEKNT